MVFIIEVDARCAVRAMVESDSDCTLQCSMEFKLQRQRIYNASKTNWYIGISTIPHLPKVNVLSGQPPISRLMVSCYTRFGEHCRKITSVRRVHFWVSGGAAFIPFAICCVELFHITSQSSRENMSDSVSRKKATTHVTHVDMVRGRRIQKQWHHHPLDLLNLTHGFLNAECALPLPSTPGKALQTELPQRGRCLLGGWKKTCITQSKQIQVSTVSTVSTA